MNDPFLVLEVAEDADDSTIQQAYLRKVRAFPPEREPARFQVIRRAYEAIRGERERWEYRLFNTEPPPLSDLLPEPTSAQGARPSQQELLAALDWSLRQPHREDDHG